MPKIDEIRKYKLFGIGLVPFMGLLIVLTLIVIGAYEIFFVP